MISVAIMAHPSRAGFIPELQAKLDAPSTVVWDERNNRWDTGRRSLLAHDPNASHHLVIQDDAIPCRDLVAGIEAAYQHVPSDSPLCLYLGRTKPWHDVMQRVTREAQGPWITMAVTYWGVGIVVPTSHIPGIVAWGDKTSDSETRQYDTRVGRYFRSKQIPVYFPWPSLVEHRDSPSLVPGRNGGRHAFNFLGADISALTVDFSGPVYRVPDR